MPSLKQVDRGRDGAAEGWREAYRGRRVLVTGASGFLGRWTCRLLGDAGAELWLVGRDAGLLARVAEVYGFRGAPLIVDLARPGAFAEAYASAKPAITFNLAGYGVDRSERDADLGWRINAALVEEIARIVLDAGPTPGWDGLGLVHAGSAFEYGRVAGALSEATEPRPDTPYGRAKLAGTRALEGLRDRSGLAAVAARLPTVYGPGEHPHRLLPTLLRAAESGEPVPLTGGEQERDFTYVRDAAEGLLRLGTLAGTPAHVVNLATGWLTAVRRFVEYAASVLGLEPGQVRLGALPYRQDEVWQGKIDVSRLRSLVGWRPGTTIPEGITQTKAFRDRHREDWA